MSNPFGEFGYNAQNVQFVLHLHGDTVCVKVKWMFPAVSLGPEPSDVLFVVLLVYLFTV